MYPVTKPYELVELYIINLSLAWYPFKKSVFGLILFASMLLVPFSAMPPYIPSISSLDDTSIFDEVEKPKPPPNLDSNIAMLTFCPALIN